MPDTQTHAAPDANDLLMGTAAPAPRPAAPASRSDIELMKIMWERMGWDAPNESITEIARNPDGRTETQRRRPRIVPPGRDVALLYYSPSSTANMPDGDRYSLNLWKQRQVAIGVALEPGLQDLIISHQDDKDELDRLVQRAMRRAGSDSGADKGTARHKLAEKIDFGVNPGPLSPRMQADIDAYRAATAGLEMVLGEMFVVDDIHKMGGTFDRVCYYQGRYYIADLKPPSTGYGQGAHAVQFSIYSRAEVYNWNLAQTMIAAGRTKELPTTNLRAPLPGPVDRERAIVIHVPRDGIGRAYTAWINISAGWDGFEHAQWMRRWQNRDFQESLEIPFEPVRPPNVIDIATPRPRKPRGAATPAAPGKAAQRVLDAAPTLADDAPLGPPDAPPAESSAPPTATVEQALAAAATLDALKAVYAAHRAAWTPALTEIYRARREAVAPSTPAPNGES